MAQCWITLLGHVKEVGKCIVTEALWPPVKRHIDYWWFFGDNIQGLRDEIRCLERERRNMDQKIEEARLRAESATTEVANWSDNGTQKLEEATRILQSCDELKPWNIIPRYLVGKSAKKTTEGIAKLRNEGSSVTISYPAPPPSMGSLCHEPIMEFESRRCIEEDIMESLNDDHVRMIAICGAGGVGKTTLVRRIEDRVRQENFFDEVVHVVVSQQIDILKFQKEIAELLSLNFSEDTLAGRAHKLHTRLVDSKRKLIIFDDVWKRFNLTDLGVPFENDFVRCKIILTSRVKDACKRMNAKIIPMEVLTKEEAWTLFKEKAGSYVEDLDLRPIADDVVEECKCLPLALVIVGEALKDQSIPVWRDSLSQLRNPMDFTELIDDVYKPLKLSYDFLENESVKSLFLLCCLFPEDYSIPIELLTFISIGLGMHEGIKKIEEGRNRTYSFVEKLKSRFLLMDGYLKYDIKMHDVVRDMAIFFGSKEKHGFLKSLEVSSMDSSSKDSSHNCNWMSIDIAIENFMLPVGPDYPNLRLLMILSSTYYNPSSEVFDANVIYFEGMEELNVLSFSLINLGSLPPTLKLLKKLRTLHLESCGVRDISVVGELTSLEILHIRHCENIEELPADIGRLNRLRLLELNFCEHLKRVVAGVISSLVRLEELKIIRCFDKWEAKGNQSEERNAALSELETLHNLTCLEIYISDSNLVAQEICLSQQLVRYRICFPEAKLHFYPIKYEREISLNLRGDITIGNWIHQLVRSTRSLILSGDGSNYINLAEIESLKELGFTNCSTVKKIDCKFHVLEKLYLRDLTEVESIADGSISAFQRLKSLYVMNLPKLAHLWRSPNQNVSLANLKEIIIQDCPSLRSLFSLETVRSLVQLQLLEIERCDMIEQLFWSEIESNIEDEIIEFPRLTYLKITDCPKLRTKIGKCPDLRTIQLYTFNGLHHLISSCCTRTWNTQLHKLSVSDCDTVEELLVDEIEDEGNRHIIFPELEVLSLVDLPCLTTFYRGVDSIKFPKLKRMKIGNLARMNSLAPMDSEATHDDGSLHFFCNQKVEIPCLDTLCITNLHDTISKIWCCHVSNNFFRNLSNLFIYDINCISNLMSSSIAKNLVNLGQLVIEGCQNIVDVIEDDKQVCATSLFPELKWLTITKLQKLRSFCQWKHAFELPSLYTIKIVDCPVMETFSLGSPSSPNLSDVHINGERVEVKGLNDCIRDHSMTKSQEGDKPEYS